MWWQWKQLSRDRESINWKLYTTIFWKYFNRSNWKVLNHKFMSAVTSHVIPLPWEGICDHPQDCPFWWLYWDELYAACARRSAVCSFILSDSNKLIFLSCVRVRRRPFITWFSSSKCHEEIELINLFRWKWVLLRALFLDHLINACKGWTKWESIQCLWFMTSITYEQQHHI